MPFSKRGFTGIEVLVVVVVIGLIGFGIYLAMNPETQETQPQELTSTTVKPNQNPYSLHNQGKDMGDRLSLDPLEKGKALANGNCRGTGSKPLTSAPMNPSDLSIIIPYGLMATGHVTPIDHQYYWGKVQMGEPDIYDVLAPADGTITEIQYRPHPTGSKTKGDYRVVITYSCTFFSYFDLVTSLSDKIQKELPDGWETNTHTSHEISIPVSAGQIVGKVGGQSLDFAVWDTTKSLANLLVPDAYNNAEPWKLNTVPPLDYFTEEVKQQILPFYARTLEPLDGVIDQDKDGYAVGNWFKEGTYGYAGSENFTGGEYWGGHLALVRDHLAPDSFVFSIGDWSGQALQFAIKNPSVTPDQVTPQSGMVKYEVAQWNHIDSDGKSWHGEKPADITVAPGPTKGTVLIEMLENRKLKVETFPNQTPDEVTGFTDRAHIYTRGEDASASRN